MMWLAKDWCISQSRVIYLVGLPIAILLAFFTNIGGKGLWLGILCAITLQAISFLAITMKTNWEEEAKKATERVFESKVPKEMVF